jgi:serine/threonine protein phosphatase PrpC
MTYTEAVERAEAAQAAAATETSDGLAGTTGVPEDDLQLTDEEAGRRQAWEGEIPVDPPTTWPDRPLVVVIGDGVSSALRSAEISRLATRTAWYRTFYHLHALSTGAPPTAAKPWLTMPPGWPAPGPDRDRLLVRALSRAFADANLAVIMAGQAHRRQDPHESRPTATTLTLLALDGMRYFLVHVGDCSAYHVHGDSAEVEPRQVEHNRAAAYAQIDPAHYAQRYVEARRRGQQNVLTRWVGMTTDWAALDPQVLEPPGELVPGDALVLCSDGLDKHVDQDSIGRAAAILDAAPAARRLVGWANDRGGSDHVAVAVLHTRRPGSAVPAAARWALWREELAVAWHRYRADTLGLALAVATAAVLVAAAVFLARSAGIVGSGGPVPAATVLPAAQAPS